MHTLVVQEQITRKELRIEQITKDNKGQRNKKS